MVVPRGRLRRGYVVHLTSIDNLRPIWGAGALLASSVLGDAPVVDELGSREVKELRSHRQVLCASGGVVADYVPFYFCARSPMLYFAHTGNPLSPFKKGQAELVHLVSHVDVVAALELSFAITDRNAALGYASFSADLHDMDNLVDWTLQQQRFWNNTTTEPDRMERRMAEFLVHQRCPVDALLSLVTIDDEHRGRVLDTLDGYDHPEVVVKRNWYY